MAAELDFITRRFETGNMDKLINGLAADGSVRVLAAQTNTTVIEAVRRHNPSPVVAAALGRTLTGASLMAATQKDLDRLTIRIDADGPVGAIVAEADNSGGVRGYVKEPLAESASRSDGKFDVAGIVGGGMFYVIRESGFELGLHREPYVGSVPITSGEIAEDLAFYLYKSEQIPSAVMLGVLLQNSEPYVTAAGGVLIQMLPGANEHIITMIEDTIKHAPHPTEILRGGGGPEDLLRSALGVIDFEILDEREVAFRCTCSTERARQMMISLGADELRSMLDDDGQAVMNCGFCNEVYRFDAAALQEMIESVTDQPTK